ncbi:MAG TPA: DUF5996 family protein [Acidimicrobiia bacterium]|nr:DUF5996 family protein [Acidimicrobiia bacterium]
MTLVPFPDTWNDTARVLHGYARVLGAVPRAHAEPQAHWWHVGLEIEGQSLVTAPVPLPGGGVLRLGMAPGRHTAWMQASKGFQADFPLDGGLSANELAEAVLGNAAELGLPDGYDRARFESDEVRPYDRGAAIAYWENLMMVAAVLDRRRDEMSDPGGIHIWPHHFDMSFEWYGSRQVEGEDGSTSPAQINLGFNVLDDPYLYSSPWPFDEGLLDEALPGKARWHTDGWTGSMLPFEALLGQSDWEERVLEYARAVYRVSLPGLTG